MINLYQRAAYQVPDKKERQYYVDWASSEFKANKNLDVEDTYILNIKMAQAVGWADQFEKLYNRTTIGYEKKDSPHSKEKRGAPIIEPRKK